MTKLTKKQVQNWLNETVSEDWKAYKRILKDEKGYITKQDFLNWSAGYISALKRVIELLGKGIVFGDTRGTFEVSVCGKVAKNIYLVA